MSKHDDLQQMVIILPSKGRSILQHYLIEVLETPQFAPEIFSIEAFIEHLSSLKSQSNQQLFCLFEAYKKIFQKIQDDFTHFMQ